MVKMFDTTSLLACRQKGIIPFAYFSGFLEWLKSSKWFLTAKGKYVDSYELHSFGVGLLLGLMRFVVPGEFRAGYWALVLSVCALALGVGGFSQFSSDSISGQLKKEGQYFLLGLMVGFIPVIS